MRVAHAAVATTLTRKAQSLSADWHAGPLIRIIGDRFAWEIKAAILHTLGLLIAKAGAGLKPFVPQLQTTFLKCLGDQVSGLSAHIPFSCTTCGSSPLFQSAVPVICCRGNPARTAVWGKRRRARCARALRRTWES